MMRSFSLGAIMMGFAVAALFFFKFYRSTRDRLFALFSASFGLLALNQVAFAIIGEREEQVVVYALRLFAFALILIAVLDKNRRST